MTRFVVLHRARTTVFAAVGLLAASAAFAEGPKVESLPNPTISIGVGEVKRLTFDEPVARLDVALKDVVDVMPQSEREFLLQGVSSTQTRIVAFAPDGHRVYSGTIFVTPQPAQAGHLVRMYRTTPKPKGDEASAGADPGREDDFSEVWCTSNSCTRPDRGPKR